MRSPELWVGFHKWKTASSLEMITGGDTGTQELKPLVPKCPLASQGQWYPSRTGYVLGPFLLFSEDMGVERALFSFFSEDTGVERLVG